MIQSSVSKMHWILPLFLLFIAGNASAQDDDSVLGKWELSAGGFWSAIDSDFNFNTTLGQTDVSIDLQDDLGFETENTLFIARAAVRPWRKHQFSLGYFKLDQSSEKSIERRIIFGDAVFPVNTSVSTEFTSEFGEVSYTYYFFLSERNAFGLMVGGVFLGLDIGLSASVNGRTIADSASSDLFVPLIGFQGKHALHPRFLIDYGFGVITTGDAEIDDWSGTVILYSAGLEYRIFENFGAVVGYTGNSFDLDLTKRVFTGSIDYNVGGVYVLGRFTF